MKKIIYFMICLFLFCISFIYLEKKLESNKCNQVNLNDFDYNKCVYMFYKYNLVDKPQSIIDFINNHENNSILLTNLKDDYYMIPYILQNTQQPQNGKKFAQIIIKNLYKEENKDACLNNDFCDKTKKFLTDNYIN